MSSDVMQHELVERARESGALTKADITKAWFIYWLGAEVSSSYERLQSLILYPAITLAISYGMVHKGYTLGRDSIIGLLQGGRIKELIYGANVLGLIMMGALSASYVKITTPLKISALKGSEVVVQQILDSIAPGLLPLAAVFAIYFYLVKKGPRYTTILLSIVALSIVCSLLGVL